MITDELVAILNELGYPVYRQGSFTDGTEYPDSFFTYWNNNSEDHSHYDNSNYGYAWSFNVFFYSVDDELAYSTIEAAIQTLKNNGWVISGKGFDAISDEPTHVGRAFNAQYLQIKED